MYDVAVAGWGIAPSEFWSMTPAEWWRIYYAKKNPIGDAVDYDALYEMAYGGE